MESRLSNVGDDGTPLALSSTIATTVLADTTLLEALLWVALTLDEIEPFVPVGDDGADQDATEAPLAGKIVDSGGTNGTTNAPLPIPCLTLPIFADALEDELL